MKQPEVMGMKVGWSQNKIDRFKQLLKKKKKIGWWQFMGIRLAKD